MAKMLKRSISATISFVRKDFTQPEDDDIFQVNIPEPVYKEYQAYENNIYIILEYFQNNYEPDLTPSLLDIDYLKDIERIHLEVCEIDEEILDKERNMLIENANKSLFNVLEERLDEFYREFGIENGREFLEKFIHRNE